MQTRAWEVVAAFVLALAFVGLMRRYTIRRGVVDVPNHRSSHVRPTPRGGGVGLVCAGTLVALVCWPPALRSPPAALAVLLLGILCLVGWRDDRGGVSIVQRFSVHLLCGAAVAALAYGTPPAPWVPRAAWASAWLLWTVSSINIVNFMDGIDGLVASQAALFALSAAMVLPAGSAAGVAAAALLGGSTGFLLWNWAPARIFLGDSGSGPLGMAIALVGALATSAMPTAPILFLPLFFLYLDSLLTMVRRKRRGDRLTEPHRSHLYQRLTRAGWPHAQVSALYAVVAGPGAALVLLASRLAPAPLVALIVLYLTVLVGLWWHLDGLAGGAAGEVVVRPIEGA